MNSEDCALPNGWTVAKVGDVADDVVVGFVGKSTPFYVEEDGVPFLTGKDVKPNRIDTNRIVRVSQEFHEAQKKSQLTSGDVVIVRIGNSGTAAVVPEDFGQANCGGLIIVKKPWAVLSDYLALYFNSPSFQEWAKREARGVTRDTLNTTKVEHAIIPVPPLAEQRRIVRKIGSLFAQLNIVQAATTTAADNVDRAPESIIDSYMRGVSSAKAPGQQSSESDNQLESLLSRRRNDWEKAKLGAYKEPTPPKIDSLPELPDGWIWVSPEQISSAERYSLGIGPFGSNLLASDYRENGIPLVFVRNIRSCQFIGPGMKYISEEKAKELSAHIVSPGDILITKMGDPPGDACMYPEWAKPAVITSDCIKWTLCPSIMSKQLFVHAFRSKVVKDQIAKITRGVAQQKISLERFKKIGIPFPPLEHQSLISSKIDISLNALNSMRISITVSKGELDLLKARILRDAFEGKLVPQDPSDEPASVLLKHIRAKGTKGRGKQAKLP